jgi:hypothetical protein
MSRVVVSTDSGRNEVKFSKYTEDGIQTFSSFKSTFGFVDFNYTKNIPILNYDKDNDIIAKVDEGIILAVGNITQKLFPPEDIKIVTDDRIYLDQSIIYTLISIGKSVKEGDEVLLGINLTSNNINLKDDVRDKLKGNHTVTFYNNAGTVINKVSFTVAMIGVFFQGWTSCMELAIDSNFNIVNEYAEADLLTIDMGRRTLDVNYTSKLSPRKNASYNFGVEKFLKYIKDQLHTQFNIIKETHEIEYIISNNKTLKVNGKPVDLKNIMTIATDRIALDIKNVILEDFSNYSYDRCLFTGGGALMFASVIKQIFPDAEIMDDPVFSNVKGLTKLMVRKFIKNIKNT